jgi:hypothetical protein
VKLSDLLEMPVLRPTELTPKIARPFYTMQSIERSYDAIYKGVTLEGQQYWCLLRKDKQSASIGIPGQRDDGAHGLDVIGNVDFKPTTILSGRRDFTIPKSVLQVSLVEIVPKRQSRGWGLYLYTALAEAGYVVVSDNTQYIGGQALWKRIASDTLHNKYRVYIIKNGEPLTNDAGNLIEYDGSNIDDAQLWSTNSDHKYTLFALRKPV